MAKVHPGEDGWIYLLPSQAVNLHTGEVRPLQLPAPYRAVSAVAQLEDGRLAIGTRHGGRVGALDPRTGKIEDWGRPLPQLAADSGEEIAPIAGLARGTDGLLYGVVGTGARGRPEAHLFRMEPTGWAMAGRVPESVSGLVAGADGRIYGVGRARVVVLEPEAP